MQEKRSTERFAMESIGCAIINGSTVDLKTCDVSESGALVEFFSPPPLKNGAKLRMHLNIGFIGRAVVCRISTRNGHTLYGLKFDRFDFHSDLTLGAYFVKHQHHSPGMPTIH